MKGFITGMLFGAVALPVISQGTQVIFQYFELLKVKIAAKAQKIAKDAGLDLDEDEDDQDKIPFGFTYYPPTEIETEEEYYDEEGKGVKNEIS